MVQALVALIFFCADDPKIALVTQDEKSPAVRSLQTLWPERLRINPAASKEDVALVLSGDPRPWIDSGATMVLDLPLFAAAFGGALQSVTMENPNRLPIDPYDIKTIEAAGREYGEYLSRNIAPGEKTLAIKAGLKVEVAEPIPSIRIEIRDPALRGFAVGDIVPWCGHRKGEYRQRTISGGSGQALAVSTVNGGAVMIRKGNIYGIDLDLEEPNNTWDNRGAFHKWVPLSNLAGPGVRAGRYWPRKPSYAEFAREVRSFSDAHPEWTRGVVGRRGADEIYSLTLGDPAKPLYVFIGMPHAEDEWVPALGSLSFAELLSRERDRGEAKSRLEKFSVKIYPLLHPSIYESPLVEPGRPAERDVLDLEKTRHDRAVCITQLHQGGDVLVPACGTPMTLAKRIAERARTDFAGRHVWWNHLHGKYGPQVWEDAAPIAVMPPSWSVYWWQDGKTSCYGLYPHDVVFGAKAMYFVEQDFIGLMPERFTQANAHHALHRMLFEHSSVASLLLTDQTANWGLSILLTDIAGDVRDPDWRPGSRAPVVALDGYHNDETPPHYTWDDPKMGGYSQFGDLLKELGAELTTIKTAFTSETLAKANVLIISDPDTPAESKDPKYISKEEIGAVTAWVENGGVLVLFGNDKGNCEFKHFNELAGKFGITFNEDKANTGGPAFGPLPDHPFFKDAKKLHIKDMCTLQLAAPAEPALQWEGQTLMATSKKGKGTVLALGDPWIYNEYINHQDNKAVARNLFRWLLDPARK
jgi:hypothetical protein